VEGSDRRSEGIHGRQAIPAMKSGHVGRSMGGENAVAGMPDLVSTREEFGTRARFLGSRKSLSCCIRYRVGVNYGVLTS
jgi:hypothetical protein